MLFFLDNWQSVDPDAFQRHQEEIAMRRARAFPRLDSEVTSRFATICQAARGAQRKNQERGLNENYGREVMELHTVGVDAGYTQQDVIEMAAASPAGPFASPAAILNSFSSPNFTPTAKKS